MANYDATVVIPTYEEAHTIGGVVQTVLGSVPHDCEVLVVDDSPTPDTVEVVRGIAETRRAVSAIKRDPSTDETGLSSAVLEGFNEAVGDYYAVLDGDGQHPPRRLTNLLYRLEAGADLVVASRHVDGGGIAGEWPTHRRWISEVADSLARLAVPQARAISDPMSGFFAVDADVVDGAGRELRPHGYKILLEVLARCPVDHVEEVPYTFQERTEGASSLGPREYVRYLRHLARLTVPSRRPTGSSTTAATAEVSET